MDYDGSVINGRRDSIGSIIQDELMPWLGILRLRRAPLRMTTFCAVRFISGSSHAARYEWRSSFTYVETLTYLLPCNPSIDSSASKVTSDFHSHVNRFARTERTGFLSVRALARPNT